MIYILTDTETFDPGTQYISRPGQIPNCTYFELSPPPGGNPSMSLRTCIKYGRSASNVFSDSSVAEK